jgi:hypothetical protein
MSTQYRLVQSGKTASGSCSAGQGSSEPVAPRIYLLLFKGTSQQHKPMSLFLWNLKTKEKCNPITCIQTSWKLEEGILIGIHTKVNHIA